MTSKDTESKSGASILRYSDGQKDWEAPNGEDSIQQISDHIERHIGEVDAVFHEIVSDAVHIDVHHVKPTPEKPFHTLVTSGMSDLPMNVPEGAGSSPYAELMVLLPDGWQIGDESFKDENWYWPIRELKFLARFPHKYDSWLGWGHTVPNGDPAEPYANNTDLSGCIILSSMYVPEEFTSLTINDNKTIEFLSFVPLYKEEMKLKLDKGSDVLLDKFQENSISDLVNVDRKNIAKKRFGIF